MYFRHRDGVRAEQKALVFLRRHGLGLVERNFRCRHGEIDLIMNDRGCLVFVEVRYRARADHVGALESIDHAKQHRLRKTAELYLLRSGQSFSRDCRFDAVGIEGRNGRAHISWVKNAF